MSSGRSLDAQLGHLLTQLADAFTCLNCDASLEGSSLYCSDLCIQMAELIRYARRCRRDGRDQRADVREAIEIKIGLVLGGGYDERARRLAAGIRDQVKTRDRGLCVLCGQIGTVLDHKAGSSPDLANLQLLCVACHNAKTKSWFRPLDASTDIDVFLRAAELQDRMEAPSPLRLCDSDRWGKVWQRIHAHRRSTMKNASPKT